MAVSTATEATSTPSAPGTPVTPAEGITLLQAAADPVRWAVLNVLADGPRCVCDLQERVPVAGNLMSYHLKILRDAGLVHSARRGRWIDYSLADDAVARLGRALPGVRR